MPHKFNAARWHKFDKAQYRVINWAEYNESLRQRGDLTIWVSEEAQSVWSAPRRTSRGGHRPSHSALRHMGMNGEFNFRGRNPVKIRCCQYLNNVVEQDHRRVKGRLRPMLGFKTFYDARRVIIGIELAQKIHKRQFVIPIPWQSNPTVIWRHVMAA